MDKTQDGASGEAAATEAPASELPGFVGETLRDLWDGFSADGTFWEVGNFMAGWDPHFGFRDWLKVFRTVPSLRKYLIPALAWNCLAPRRHQEGFSERFVPGRKYNFRYRSFCTDLLVWESAVLAARHFGVALPRSAFGDLGACLNLVLANRYDVPFEGRDIPMFSYFPRRDHLVPRDNAVYRLFFSRDDNVPDIDTTCLILGSALLLSGEEGAGDLPYAHDLATTLGFLSLMEQHVHGQGRYGRKSLSYENGTRIEDRGVMTWVFDDHNEVDPTSNVNILAWLALIRRAHPDVPAARVTALARGILAFLARHAADGSLLSPRFQSYYPLGPVFLFWRRFRRAFDSLPEDERAAFDPDDAVAAVDSHLAAEGETLFLRGGARINPYDRLTAAPFLYERGMGRETLADMLAPESGFMARFLDNHYEIFRL
ncbi:MAG TPA: hypothetical protein VK465_09260, partial [Fibrobacteria bacterium]|nr:hypothetical protein [Fibrobacteria bacterium]